MAQINFRIPEELKKEMDLFPEINWSVVARKALEEKIMELKKVKAIIKEMNLSQKDVKELEKEVKEGIKKRHGL